MLELSNNLIEGKDFIRSGGEIFITTKIAADLLNINRITINRDCLRSFRYGTGNLGHLPHYIKRSPEDGDLDTAHWYVRQDIDEVYTLDAPGKAGRGDNPRWFRLTCLEEGEKPR